MDNVALSTQITASLFGFNNTCPDDPYGGSSGVGITIPGWGNGVWGTQIVFDYNGLAPFFRTFFSFGQSVGDWIKLATATPPQEFDLPLAEGITALQPCTYWKNQFEEVTIYGCTYGEVTEGDTIATLPEGFRPDHPVEWPASFTGDAGRVSGTVFISESGIVSIHTTAPAMSVVFAASFLAAG